jgi:hypothetical protein
VDVRLHTSECSTNERVMCYRPAATRSRNGSGRFFAFLLMR